MTESAKTPIRVAAPATAHSIPGIDEKESVTRPSTNGVTIYVPSPAARGKAIAVASAPTGAISWANACKAGPWAVAPILHPITTKENANALVPKTRSPRNGRDIPEESSNGEGNDRAKGIIMRLAELTNPLIMIVDLALIRSVNQPPTGPPTRPLKPAADKRKPCKISFRVFVWEGDTK